VIVSRESHAEWHETGASAANAGVQFTPIGNKGVFTEQEFVAAIKPRGHVVYPPTTLIEIENTHNRAGGVVFPQDDVKRICDAAASRDIATFLDGARLLNAAVASKRAVSDLATPFGLVSLALSKGLGAPAGTMLAGSRDVIDRCVRFRRRLGGAMRQAGLLAAAGLYGLDHNIDRLADDHANARVIADRLSQSKKIVLDRATVQTNILVFGLTADAADAPTVVSRAKERGVLIFAFGPRTIRAVTHLDVSRQECERAADVLLEIVG